MRGVGGVLGGMSLEQVQPFWAHMSKYKLEKSLERAILGVPV